MKLVPLFSIESGHVSGAFISLNDPAKPQITFTYVEDLPLSESRSSGQILQSSVVSAVTSVSQKLASYNSKNGSHKIDKAIVYLGAPWYSSQATTVRSSNISPFVVKETLIDSLVDGEVKHFEGKKNSDGELAIIDKKITHTVLNGYHTNKPIGKKVTSLEFQLFLAVTSQNFKNQIEEAVHSSLSHGIESWQTMPPVLFAGLHTLNHDISNFLIVDMGAEVTEVSLVRDSKLTQTVSLPYGTATLIRHIGRSMKVTPQIAFSTSSLYQEKKAETSLVEKLEKAIQSAEKDWQPLFAETLHQIAEGLALPKTMYLLSVPELVAVTKNLIETEEFAPSALAEGKFDIIPINAPLLASIVPLPANVSATPTLLLETLFTSWIKNHQNV